jgi:adenosylmethionine-8-amino-7-oxononanoate aminotransferase
MRMETTSILPHFANPIEFRKSVLVIDRADGVYFWDSSGKRYLDGVAGVMVVNVGYGNREIIEAMKRQMDKLCYNFLSYSASSPALETARRLTEILPGDMKEVFFTTGGSEAADTAIKVSRLYHVLNGEPKRYRFVGRWISYHGSTIGGLSCSGHAPRRKDFEPLLLHFPHAAPAYCYRCPFGREYPDCQIECATSVEQLILNEGLESIAGFIAEPIVGSTGGALVPPPEYFRIVREICDTYGILLVIDEVLTGFGRTGAMFASDHWEVKPDIVMVAKGLSSGYAPIGAVAINESISDAFETGKGTNFAHGFTFAGHPVSCAAALTNMEILKREKLPERSLKSGEYLMEKFRALDHRIIGDVRGKGLLVGVELVKDRKSKENFPASRNIAEEVSKRTLKRGVKIFGLKGHNSGMISDFLVFSPPLIITEEQLDLIVEAVDATLREIEANI